MGSTAYLKLLMMQLWAQAAFHNCVSDSDAVNLVNNVGG